MSGWLDVRADIDHTIEVFEATAAKLIGRQQDTTDARKAIMAVAGSREASVPIADASDQLDALARRLEKLAGQAAGSARLCREYLATVDPDDAAGSIVGLPTPRPAGTTHGGHQVRGGPPVPPARQPLTDESRRRCHVYTEQATAGLNDLHQRQDGLLDWRRRYLDSSGHARLRHGGGVTDAQLRARVEHGIDPITGTVRDWETNDVHRCADHATAFASDADLAWAEMMAADSTTGQRQRRRAEDRGGPKYTVTLPASEVFGPQFRDHLRGWSLQDGQSTQPTAFPDDTIIRTTYRRDSVEKPWHPVTCYPEFPMSTDE